MATHTLDFERPLLELERQIEEMKRVASDTAVDVSKELTALERKLAELREEIYKALPPMQRVQVARHPRRPYTLDYVNTVFTDFVELHGDRLFRDDPAIVGGWARLDGMSVMLIGHQKGRDTKENLHRNFGMAHPEGYRKALRLMGLAEKFGAPVITLVDTPGAYPGLGAEERGQAGAGRRGAEDHRRRPAGAGRDRRDHSRAARGRPRRPRRGRGSSGGRAAPPCAPAPQDQDGEAAQTPRGEVPFDGCLEREVS